MLNEIENKVCGPHVYSERMQLVDSRWKLSLAAAVEFIDWLERTVKEIEPWG